jgi:hypothetical protein
MVARSFRRYITNRVTNPIRQRKRANLFVEQLEVREVLTAFTPGNLVILQSGDSGQYSTQGPVYLDEFPTTVGGAQVQQAAIGNTATVGGTGNQPLTIDLTAAAGNGQLNRTYDGAGLVFGGVDSGLNNGGYTLPLTPTGSANRVIAVVGNDPAAAGFLNTTTYGPFYVGDDNRGGVADSLTGPVYSFGHPNQAGGAVSQGVLYFPGPNGDGSLQPPGTAGIGPQSGVQVSSETNIRGGYIGFNNVVYWTTAGATSLGTAGIYQSNVAALPTANQNGQLDTPVVKALFSASKVGGMFLADVNGNGILDNGDRIYLLDDGTVGGVGTGGLYESIYDTTRWGTAVTGQAAGWSPMVRVAEGIVDQSSSAGGGNGGVAQLRGLTGTVLTDGSVQLYSTEFDNVAANNSYLFGWNDPAATNLNRVSNATFGGGTATVTLTDALAPSLRGTTTWLSVNSIGTGGGNFVTNGGFNGVWDATVSADGTQITYADPNSPANVSGSGMVGVWLNTGSIGDPTNDPYPQPAASQTLQTFADGTLTASASKAQHALRGVAFAPVAATTVTVNVDGVSSETVPSNTTVTFTANVSNPQVTPTGKVTFIDETTNGILGQGTISGGVATLKIALAGQHIVKAYFAGGGTSALAPATSSGTATVNATQGNASSSTALSANIGGTTTTQAAVGRAVTLNATITVGGTAATGTVSFYNGSTLIGSGAVSSNAASLVTSFNVVGTANVTATYNGDAQYVPSTSSTDALNIQNNASATITSSANNTAVGATPTYSVTVSGAFGAAAGSVQFFLDGTALGSSQTLNGSGQATVVSTALSAGSHLVTVTYTAGATSPYNNFAMTTSTTTGGVAFIETARQPLTPGNLLAVQRGDGSVNLGSSGYLVFLDEYTPAGVLVQRIALPNADSGTTHAVLLSGQNGSEGLIQQSGNGQYLTIVGYDTVPGQPFLTSSQPYQYGRTIARIDANGNVDTSTSIGTVQTPITGASWASGTATINTGSVNANLQVGDPVTVASVSVAGYNGTFTVTAIDNSDTSNRKFSYALANNPGGSPTGGTATGPSVPYNPEDVVTNDGTSFWLASSTGTGDTTDSGILYATLGSSTAKQVGPTNHGAASIGIYGSSGSGQLAVVNRGSGELGTPKGLVNVGTGLPTSGLGVQNITTLHNDGSGNVTVTLTAAPNFAAGNQVVISGSSVAAYNTAWQVATVVGSTFTITGAPSGAGDGTGGTATANQLLSGFQNLEAEYEAVFPTGRSPEQFVFLNTQDGSSNNPNLAYIADQAYGLLKFWKANDGNWHLGRLSGNAFGEKLVFAGGATGVVATIINPGTASAKVNIYVTGSNVQQANPNQIAFFQDQNGAPAGTGGTGVDQGFSSGTFVTTAFVGGTQGGTPPASPNGNMNFAGLAFVPGFVQGNVVVTQVGTGTGSLTSNATASFLNEYTPGGVQVGSITLPTSSTSINISAATWASSVVTITTSAAHIFTVGEQVTIAGMTPSGYNGTFAITTVPDATHFTYALSSSPGTATKFGTATGALGALTEGGTATGEGYLTDSADGHTLSIAGYNQLTGLSTSGANRVVGVVNAAGVVDVTTQMPSTAGNVRVAISADGQGFYVATSNGVVYVPFANGASTAGTTVTQEVSSPTAVGIGTNNTTGSGTGAPGILFGSAGAGAQTNGVPALDSPFTIGDPLPLPQDGGNAIHVSPSFPTARDIFNNFPSTNQFAVSPDGLTIFIADNRTDSVGGILEYFESTANSWALLGHLQLNSFSITDAKETGTTVTITTAQAYTFPAGQKVDIEGVGTGYNTGTGGATITVVDSTHFTYTSSTTGLSEITNAGVATSVDGGLRGLVADFSGSTPVLYATTSGSSGNRLVQITGGTIDGNNPTFAFSTLATAPTNTAFRGVALSPTNPGTTTTTTTLSVSPSSANYGAGVTLTAAVTGSSPGGWVSFRNGSTEIGTAQLNGSGTATYVTAGNLPAGSYSNLVAVYTGDSTNAPSTSTPQSATINKATPGVSLSTSANPVAIGTNDSFTGTLTGVPIGTTPTGTLTFKDGSTTLGSGTVTQLIVNQSGNPVILFETSFTTAFTTLGHHSITAVYSGDSNFNGATSSALDLLVVNPTYTTVTSSNANPTASPSTTVTYSATVASPGGTATGTVQFYDNLLPIGSAQTLVSGSASVTINTALLQSASGSADLLTPGQHAISAVYVPDVTGASTFFGSTNDYIQNVQAQGFSSVDTFVYRVGDGTTPLNPSAPSTVQGSIGSTIFVDEYTPTGTLVQSLALPTADGPTIGISAATETSNTVTITTGVPHGFTAGQQVVIAGVTPSGYNGAFTIASIVDSTHFTYTDSATGLAAATAFGTATTSPIHAVVGNGQQSPTGQMTLSGDGQYLFVSGYDNNPLNLATALPIPTATGNSAVPRDIARVKYDGTVSEVAFVAGNNGVESNPSFSNFNGVYSPDGNQYYLAGGVGVYYGVTFAPTPALLNPTLLTNISYTTVGLEGFGPNLYAAGTPYTGANLVGQFGAYPTTGKVNITAASETSTTVTITTSAAHGFQSGEFILISGVTPSGYNGTFPITVTDSTHFTYTDTSGLTGGTAFGSAQPTLGQLSGLPSTDTAQQFPVDMYLTHLNGSGAPAGLNTMYISDDGTSFAGGQITKWALSSGGTWSKVDAVTAGAGNNAISFYWISGRTDSNGNATLYVTYGNGGNSDVGPGQLYSIADQNGWNAPIGTGGTHSDAVTILAAVGGGDHSGLSTTNAEIFRGVAASPLPLIGSVVSNGNKDTFAIAGVSESGTTVTVTTQKANNFVTGQLIEVSGVGVVGYNTQDQPNNNGTPTGPFFTITVVDSRHFTYTLGTSGLAQAALGGQATAVSWGIASTSQPAPVTISSISEASGNVATVTTSTTNTFSSGDQIIISGMTTSAYNGTFSNITVVDSTHFTIITSSSANGTDNTNGNAADSTATAVMSGTNGLVSGDFVTVTGNSVAGYNGTYKVTRVVGDPTISFNVSQTGLGAGTGGTAVDGLAGRQRSMVDGINYSFDQPVTLAAGAFSVTPVAGTASIASVSESGSTATITTTAAHGFYIGDPITISVASNDAMDLTKYNGTFTVLNVPSTTSFTVNLGTTGAPTDNNVTGTAVIPTIIATASNPSGDNLNFVVSFSVPTLPGSIIGNSIFDGAFNIQVILGNVTLMSNGMHPAGTDHGTDVFVRQFSDVNGDQVVNTFDNRAMARAIGTASSDAAYLAYLDFNADGVINTTDNRQFSSRFNLPVAFGPFLPTI